MATVTQKLTQNLLQSLAEKELNKIAEKKNWTVPPSNLQKSLNNINLMTMTLMTTKMTKKSFMTSKAGKAWIPELMSSQKNRTMLTMWTT